MFPRRLKRPKHSFFLFGPRGTGKSTWLRQVLGKARWYDLLHSEVYVRLLAVGVYEGEHAQKDGPVDVLPVRGFLERLPAILRV